MLDAEGEIIFRAVPRPVEVIEENDCYQVESLEAICISSEQYESYVDAILFLSYCIESEDNDIDSFVEQWMITNDGISACVTSSSF